MLELIERAPAGEQSAEAGIGIVDCGDGLERAAHRDRGAMDADRVDADLPKLPGGGAVALAGHLADLLHHRRLHPLDAVEASRQIAGGAVLRLRNRLRQLRGEPVGIGIAGKQGGEEGLAALELGGAIVDGEAHRGDVGFHPRHLALHPRHIAVERGESGISRAERPCEQQKDRRSGRHLQLRADREAAQALPIVQENIARLEQVMEPDGQAGVRCQLVARHQFSPPGPSGRRGRAQKRPL